MSLNSFFNKDLSPYAQAIVVVVLMLLFILFACAMELVGISEKDEMTPWIVAIAMLMFYAVMNCILSLSNNKEGNYWIKSVFSFIIIALCGIFLSWLISGMNILESKSIKWIFLVFGFVYLVLISIFRSMRSIVQMAQKQEDKES